MYSNDPSNPVVKLMITAFVKPEVEVIPERLQFTDMVMEQPITQKVTLKNVGEKTLTLSRIEIIPRHLLIKASLADEREFPVVLRTDESLDILVSVTPQGGRKRMGGRIVIHAKDRARPPAIIPFTGTIRQVSQQ